MIGIFDSGVGGMTVARAIEEVLPERSILYFGDVARTPYGSKSPATISRYAVQNCDFLLANGAKLIIVACNTAASVAGHLLQQQYEVPIMEVITPAVAQAVQASRSGRIGVIGTRATINSRIYEEEIRALNPGARVLSQACPLLVPLVEEGWLAKRETKMILRRYLHPLKVKGVDTLVLGCTHYPLLSHLIQPRMGRRVRVIDSSLAVAHKLKQYLDANPAVAGRLATGGERRYYVSDITEAAQKTAGRIFGRKMNLELAQVNK
ncbi:MAG: glutamate racemase [Desulfobulbaceae bacterium]|nr:MAG: glutamate racemase [Desulfobulbaceae bacterium]